MERAELDIVLSNSNVRARSVEYFRTPRDVLTICVGMLTCARCGIASVRDAIRAGVGGIRNTGNLYHHAATGQGQRQRRAVPDFVYPLRCVLRGE